MAKWSRPAWMLVLLLLVPAACTPSADPTAISSPGGGGSAPVSAGPATSARPASRVLSGSQSFPNGFTVPAGQVWEFAPDESTTVASGGNVVVRGVLRLRPASPAVVHALRFVNVDEGRMVGGGMGVVATDVGLWVVGAGQLDIVGSRKVGWNRTGTDPTWQSGDDIRVAPLAKGNTGRFARFTPGRAVPSVSHAGRRYSAEVFNLTRNVRIEGTGNGGADPRANGRAHIWINSYRPQTIRYAALRHLGPRRIGQEQPTEGVLGRYALHFHMMGDGSRGSIVEGVVVRDAGNHAFVPHASHGITFRDTISFNTFDDAYWWDPDAPDDGDGPSVHETHDLRYEHAMAAYTRFDPAFRGYRLAGFQMGIGKNMTVTDSVAVGIQGNSDSSGFHWPEFANFDNNVWTFSNNVAHNNNADGIFVWQNDDNRHLIRDFVAYRNGNFGIAHGAYGNGYTFQKVVLFDNGVSGIHSIAAGAPRQTWREVDTDGIVIGHHPEPGGPIVFDGLILRGSITVDESDSTSLRYEFRNARTGSGAELSRSQFIIVAQRATIVVYRADGTSLRI